MTTTQPSITNFLGPYVPADPNGVPTGETGLEPFALAIRNDIWGPLLGTVIDEMSSHPRTLDLLGQLVGFTNPNVVVEVGTYRGWGTAVLAETLRIHDLPGHVWTCDPENYGVDKLIDCAGLSGRVTYVQGTFEHLLAQLDSKIDFCYIDASDPREAGLRLRYTKLALQYMNPGGLICVDDAASDWRGSKTLRRMAHLYLPQHRGLAVITKP